MRQFRSTYTVIFLTLSSLFIGFAQSSSPFFKNGDVICFLGDSITHGGQYHEFLQLFYATRYPNMKLSFHNCGISGDNAAGMIDRLEDDVLKHNPTHVFLMTGMNDVNRTLYFEGTASDKILKQRANALAACKQNTTLLAEKIVENNVTPIFLTPSIYDQYSKIERENNVGCNDALIECSDHIKAIANRDDATVVDLNAAMKNIMEQELQKDSLFTIVGKDRVHPEATGHFIMFQEIIAVLEQSSVVSKIEIDFNSQHPIVTAKNCQVSEVQISNNDISFQWLENSLPFPVEKHNQALALVPFEQNFNQQTLQTHGIGQGAYDLFIEDQFIETFSSEALAKGINLASNTKTPQYKQAQEIMRLCAEYRKTGYQLRAVPFIKFKYLHDYNGPNNVLQKKLHLDKKLDEIKGKPYYNYIKTSMDAYFETLPKVDSLKNRLNQIQAEIFLNNKPKQLSIQLVKK